MDIILYIREIGMELEFKKVSQFKRGILFELLTDAYSFDVQCQQHWGKDWQEFDDFFFDHLVIADSCGFITAIRGEPIGFVSWDPRNKPSSVIIGHNCMKTKYKEKGYGKSQLQEAICRIRQLEAEKIVVTTNSLLVSAQRMYESVGFKLDQSRPSDSKDRFSGDYLDYTLVIANSNNEK